MTSPKPELSSKPEPATSRLNLSETEVGSVFVSNYPPFSAWRKEDWGLLAKTLERDPKPETPLGLYIHIPFCRKRCKFCYFRVYTDKNAASIQSYLDALGKEFALYRAAPGIRDRALSYVYLGGGTPSYLSARQIESLFGSLNAAFDLGHAEEVTFECEPGTLSEEKVRALRELGVTRLSLGVESFDDRVLELNGRAHVSKEIHRSLPWIRDAGFDSVNIDLIAGMVGASFETWKDSVRQTLDYSPDSVTIYQMELPFNTEFSKLHEDGSLEVSLPDWNTKRRWHGYAIEELRRAGYSVSSAYTMVKDPDTDFVYRDALWHGADMIASGVSSFGHLGGLHYQNETGWDRFMDRLERGELPVARAFQTGEEDRLRRELLLQLKLGRTDKRYFENKFGAGALGMFSETFRLLAEEGFLQESEDSLELTPTGLLQVDTFLPELYAPQYRGGRYT